MVSRTAGAVAGAFVLLSLISGCTPDDASNEPPPVIDAGTDSAAPEPPVFVAPATCTEMVGSELEAIFASPPQVVLFASTDGQGIYADSGQQPAQSGGDPFFCLYGADGVDLSSFQLEVQAVSSQSEHEGIYGALSAEPLDIVESDDIVTFTQMGDEGTTGSIVHVLRLDSWLTATSAFGGAANAAKLSSYLDLIAANLYQAP